MEFDKSKVFTPFNCSEVKIGSKGYVSDYYACLKDYVEGELFSLRFGTLVYNDRKFQLENNDTTYQLFYLVEEPKEKTKRPCTMEELIEMLKMQVIPMLKTTIGNLHFTVESMSDNNVYVGGGNYTYQELCEQYTLLDGTELWVEEHKDEE